MTTARKLDPLLWSWSKREALSRMGGVHSARAMQLAVQIYKRNGGRYEGPRTGREGLSVWTRERWQTRPGTAKRAARGGTVARYLPALVWANMTPAERKATDRKKREACKGKKTCVVSNTRSVAKARRKVRGR